MPTQYTLDIPEIALPKAKQPSASQTLPPQQALGVLRQIRKDLLLGKRHHDAGGVARLTVTMRQSRADYLLRAIEDVLKGVPAELAFCLAKPRGQAKKEERDIVIAMIVRELRDIGMTLEQAIAETAQQLHMAEESVRTSVKKGKRIAALISKMSPRHDLRAYRAHQHLIDLLHTSYLKKPKPHADEAFAEG